MAKDMTGEHALNEFNMHYDPDRGWQYHVTPGRFRYMIGGYSGTEDARDKQHPYGRRGMGMSVRGGAASSGGQSVEETHLMDHPMVDLPVADLPAVIDSVPRRRCNDSSEVAAGGAVQFC